MEMFITPTWLVGRMFKYVTLLVVCLFVRKQNSKTNDPKVFKLGIGMTFGYPWNDMVLRLKGEGLGLVTIMPKS